MNADEELWDIRLPERVAASIGLDPCEFGSWTKDDYRRLAAELERLGAAEPDGERSLYYGKCVAALDNAYRRRRGAALDPADRPDPADVAAQRQAAYPPPARRTPRPTESTPSRRVGRAEFRPQDHHQIEGEKRMTENVPYPMPMTIARGTITVTEGDEQPRTLDVFVAMPATTPTDTVLQVFGEQLRSKAALAAGLADLDALPTAEDQ